MVFSQGAAIIVPLFAMICLGALVVRAGIVSAEAASGLGRLALCIEIPALLFRSLASQDLIDNLDLRISLAYLGGCLLVLLISVVLGRTVFGLNGSQAGIFGLSATYSNSSLLGVPIVQALFGAPGLLLLGKIIAFHSLLLLPACTLLVVLGRGGATGGAEGIGPALRSASAETVRNPIVIGLLAGAAWSCTGWGLTGPVDRIASLLSEAATPTALLALGGMLGPIRLNQIRQASAAVVLKLALHPLLVCLLAFGIGGLPPMAIAIATITAALPAGMNVYLLAQHYDCYLAEATAATALGTLLSVVSIALALHFCLGSIV
jgi:predicted permease